MRRVLSLFAFALVLAACDGSGGQQAVSPADPALMAEGRHGFLLVCGTCHNLEIPANSTGPHLAGIRGRKAASADGFAYSEGLRNSGIVWDEKTLETFLAGPEALVPGTAMVIEPVTDPQMRRAIAHYVMHQ